MKVEINAYKTPVPVIQNGTILEGNKGGLYLVNRITECRQRVWVTVLKPETQAEYAGRVLHEASMEHFHYFTGTATISN